MAELVIAVLGILVGYTAVDMIKALKRKYGTRS